MIVSVSSAEGYEPPQVVLVKAVKRSEELDELTLKAKCVDDLTVRVKGVTCVVYHCRAGSAVNVPLVKINHSNIVVNRITEILIPALSDISSILFQPVTDRLCRRGKG